MTSLRAAGLLVSLGFVFWVPPALAVWGSDLDGGVDMPAYSPQVSCAIEFEGDLVVGGRFSLAGDVAVTNVARWGGESWSPLGSELAGANMYSVPLSDLALHDGDLYACGPFFTGLSSPLQGVARWNGESWEPMAESISPNLFDDEINSMVSYGGDLCIGGDLYIDGTHYQFARWTGTGWDFILSSPFGSGGTIRDMTVLEDRLWVVGYTNHSHEVVAYWDGTVWTTVLEDQDAGQIRAVCAHRGRVYVGGSFTSLAGYPVEMLACWTGDGWEPGYGGTLETGFWYWNGPEPTWIGCGVYTLLSAGDRLFAGGLLSDSSIGPLSCKVSVDAEGNLEQLGGMMNQRVSFGLIWPMVYALAYAQGEVIIGGDFNEGDGIDHPLGCLIGQPFQLTAAPAVASATLLCQAAPNPFNPHTTLSFRLPEAGPCRLEVFDLRGRLVREFCSGFQASGEHRFVWNGRDDGGDLVASGVYVARLTAPACVKTRKLTLAK